MDDKSTAALSDRRWLGRIERAIELQSRYPEAAPMLQFYARVLAYQRQVARTATTPFNSSRTFREQIDISRAVRSLPDLLKLSGEHGSDLLASKARALQQLESEQQSALIAASVLGSVPLEDATMNFFAHACIQPLAENLQAQVPEDVNHSTNVCPVCGGYPQAAILRPEGDGGRRSLLCSFCLREWVFRRVICPWCGEEDKQKLPTYAATTCTHVRVQGCDSCHRYLKAVDMSIDGHAIPLVDEAAVAVLDVWATEHGYQKLASNLLGF
jgi:FdhE protein